MKHLQKASTNTWKRPCPHGKRHEALPCKASRALSVHAPIPCARRAPSPRRQIGAANPTCPAADPRKWTFGGRTPLKSQRNRWKSCDFDASEARNGSKRVPEHLLGTWHIAITAPQEAQQGLSLAVERPAPARGVHVAILHLRLPFSHRNGPFSTMSWPFSGLKMPQNEAKTIENATETRRVQLAQPAQLVILDALGHDRPLQLVLRIMRPQLCRP